MEFAWDEDKHHRNSRERGFGFDFAALIFDGPVIEKRDTRKEYGELRILALGGGDRPRRDLYRSRGCSPHYFGPPGQQEGTRRMAIVRKTLEEIKASRPKSDRRRIAATSEDEIRRQRIEDDEDPDAPVEGFAPSAKTLRLQHGMTQEQFAAALHIPVATLRNWEQGRVAPDPAAQSLLTVFAKNPRAVLDALAAR